MDTRSERLIATLRDSAEQLRREVWFLRDRLKQEQNNVKAVKDSMSELCDTNVALRKKIVDLQNTIRIYEEKNKALKPIVVNRTYDRMACTRSKLLRKRKYKNVVDNAIGCITECKRAKLTLGFEKGHLDIVWSETDMEKHRDSHKLKRNRYKFSKIKNVRTTSENVRNATPVRKISTFVTDEGLFTTKCKYSDQHVRKIVSVMDDNRI